MRSAGMLRGADRFAFGLIEYAARRAPPELSERLHEEWLAGLHDVTGKLARVRFALGCCWAINVIAREQRLAAAAAAPVTAAPGSFTTYLSDAVPGLSRRTAAFIVVAALHVGVFFAFTYGMSPPLVKAKATRLFDAAVIEKPAPRVVVEAHPKEIFDTVFTVPRPDPLVIAEPKVEDALTAQESRTPSVPSIDVAPEPPTASVVRQPGGPGAGFPSTEDYYPSAAIHLGEKGTTVVQACIDRNGRLTSAPTILIPSGSARLDDGALRLATAGSGHYRASLENGHPVDSCLSFKVVFALRN